MGRPDRTGTPHAGRPKAGLPPPQQPTPLPPPGVPPERQRSLFERYKVWFIAAGLVIVVTATGISSLGEDDDSSSSGGSSDSDLLPAHKEMVDTLAADGDCDSLQARFDDAYDARGTPGTDKHKRNPALMNYADDAMRRIDCY